MKRVFAILFSLAFLFAVAGCGSSPEVKTEDVEINYGTSSLYSREDMDAAIQVILKEFNTTLLGSKLYSISYSSDDECNEKNITRMIEAEMKKGGKEIEVFTQCIMFRCDFEVPGGTRAGRMPWWLARTDGGEWRFIERGY